MKKPKKKILTSDFDYFLPKNLIAQKPAKPRDSARLLIFDRNNLKINHKKFWQIDQYLNPGDTIVLNDSKVIPARLIGHKTTGGRVEIFLLTKNESSKTWKILIGGKVKNNDIIYFDKNIEAKIKKASQQTTAKFNANDEKIFSIGQTPLPPYIKSNFKPGQVNPNYQTVFATAAGSVAAPTAGLHFTHRLISKLKNKGINIEYITLHVGLGTFAPVKSQYINDHKIHREYAIINSNTAKKLNQTKQQGRKIIAVGTTAVRTLESFANKNKIKPMAKWVDIFIYPGYQFKFVDQMITNFHLPQSSLIMLTAAFIQNHHQNINGAEKIKSIYNQAIQKKYNFYSFGDAMLIK